VLIDDMRITFPGLTPKNHPEAGLRATLGIELAEGGSMWGWVVVISLYALGMGFFHLLGGLGAAADAIQQWGRSSSAARRPGPASS
jgi:hypothetical protein